MLEQGLGTLKGQIDKQANVFQGNPSAMGKEQQKHKDSINKGITPDLLKALAMQKVASETAAAENQLKLSMEQNSATVVEQLEQNAMARTQDDLVKQTAGILNERNKKRKQQMSPSKPPQQAQQRPPMQMAKGAPQGAPQGLPAAPRPPMQMANGGIVGYNKGGQIDKVKAFIESRGGKLSQQEMADIVNASKNNPEVIAFLTQDQGYISSAEMAEIDKAASLTASKDAPIADASIAAATAKGLSKDKPSTGIANVPVGGFGDPSTAKGLSKDKPSTGIANVPVGGFGDPSTAKGLSKDKLPINATADPLKEALGTANVSEDQLTSASLRGKDFPVNTSKTQATDALGPKTMGIMENMRDLNPKESYTEQEKRGDVRFNRDAKRKAEEALIEEKRKIDKAQLDPEALRKARVDAGIAGLIEGGTSRGASISRRKFDDNVAKRQRDAINETIKLTRDKDKSDDDRIKAIDVTAGRIFERESADRLAALQGLVGVSAENVKQINNQARIEFEANKFGIQSRLTALATKAKEDLNRLIQENANVTQYAALLKQVQAGQIAALDAMYEVIAPELKQAELNVLAGTASKKEMQMVQDRQIKYMAILDMAGMHDLIQELRAEAIKNTGESTTTTTTTDPLEDAMNKYN